ncbi:MAG: hypothetical protein OEV44_12515, partial [Spirochaetota bacterium]|nr:hypothetical protein [Spirochaetota bacterium]
MSIIVDIIENFLYSHWLFQITFLCYLTAFVLYITTWIMYVRSGNNKESSSKFTLSRVSTALFIVALAVNIVLFIFQWITMDRLPVRTLYEALIYLTITLSLI